MTLLTFAPAGARMLLSGDRSFREPELVAFSPGQSHAAVQGGSIRGNRDLYAVVARAGQTLSVVLQDPERAAALELYEPGVRIVGDAWGVEFYGNLLTQSHGRDVDSWVGELTRTGPYLIAVGATRGNATYDMRIRLS